MNYCSLGYALLGEIVQRRSGQSLSDFARDRVFEPLGMKDTSYVVPVSARHRIVKRPPDAVVALTLDSEEFMDAPLAAGGVFSTAMDMAVFGQMYLSEGRYGEARILSSAAVTEMTRHQIPGTPTGFFRGEYHDEASWGYGWGIRGQEEWKYFAGGLQSPQAFSHGGAGGIYFWVDPNLRAYRGLLLSHPGAYSRPSPQVVRGPLRKRGDGSGQRLGSAMPLHGGFETDPCRAGESTLHGARSLSVRDQ